MAIIERRGTMIRKKIEQNTIQHNTHMMMMMMMMMMIGMMTITRTITNTYASVVVVVF